MDTRLGPPLRRIIARTELVPGQVEEASAVVFDLGFGYGKDNWAVFFEGRKIKEASARSFARRVCP